MKIPALWTFLLFFTSAAVVSAQNETVTVSANASVAPVAVAATAAPAPTCTSSDQCGAGAFCSGDGVCLPLNCTNWALSPPVNEDYFAETPCNVEGVDEGSQFCGTDGLCHAYTCQDWYQFGPVAFTGYDPNNPVELTCGEYSGGTEEHMNAVIFGCRPYQPGSRVPDNGNNWVLFWDVECTAKPRNSDEFKCYMNSEDRQRDYNDFVGESARINPDSCDRDVYGGLTEQPLFWYTTMFRQVRGGGTPVNYKHGRENTKSTDSFDPSEADKTMFAVIISPDDAPDQDVFVADPSNGGGSGAASLVAAVSPWIMGLMALWLL